MPKGVYQSRFRHGNRRGVPIADRFWTKVDRDGLSLPGLTPCWLWLRGPLHRGLHYGQFTLNGGPKLAHRVAWFLTFGKWPEKDLAHRCDVPTCVNPDHLFEATPIENNRDMIAKGRHPKVGKLTDDQVADIRHRMRGAPRGTGVRLAREFGVSDALISHIVHGKVRTATPAGPIEFQAEPRNRNLKLADDDVQAIRSAYAAGGVSQTELGRTYGVHQTVISGIVRGAKRLPRN